MDYQVVASIELFAYLKLFLHGHGTIGVAVMMVEIKHPELSDKLFLL